MPVMQPPTRPIEVSDPNNPNAIFRLWRAAVKDDERLLDEAIAAVHDQMMSSDRARAEHVISLIIRRHRHAKCALRPCSMPTGGADGPHL
jgi:hypothetical protein